MTMGGTLWVTANNILLDTDVYIISDNIGEGIPIDSSQGEVIKHIEEMSKKFSEATGYRFFSYEDEGEIFFPFFLTQKDADNFCGAYSGKENKIFAFEILQVKGEVIIPKILDTVTTVMNAQSGDEFELNENIIKKINETMRRTNKVIIKNHRE
ncbi:MAG: hypothetical protein L3J71_12830 [Victivallaceae bacterium]|nr:hypothetical protein [Victivallaceae bacterium]